jgi:hypothetical protein
MAYENHNKGVKKVSFKNKHGLMLFVKKKTLKTRPGHQLDVRKITPSTVPLFYGGNCPVLGSFWVSQINFLHLNIVETMLFNILTNP